MAQPQPEHAGSRFQCVTIGVIEALQRTYRAGADLGQAIPGIDAEQAAVIVAETLEADRIWNLAPGRFLEDAAKGPMTDFKRAVLAEVVFATSDVARDAKNRDEQGKWWAIAMASLLLWYEDIYLELASAMRGDPKRESIGWVKSALAYDLRYDEGKNVPGLLGDLAEMHLAVGDLDRGLTMLTATAPRSKSLERRPNRNDPCWCGSGKKYKHRHMADDQKRG